MGAPEAETEGACQWEGTEVPPGPEVVGNFALSAASGVVLQ